MNTIFKRLEHIFPDAIYPPIGIKVTVDLSSGLRCQGRTVHLAHLTEFGFHCVGFVADPQHEIYEVLYFKEVPPQLGYNPARRYQATVVMAWESNTWKTRPLKS